MNQEETIYDENFPVLPSPQNINGTQASKMLQSQQSSKLSNYDLALSFLKPTSKLNTLRYDSKQPINRSIQTLNYSHAIKQIAQVKREILSRINENLFEFQKRTNLDQTGSIELHALKNKIQELFRENETSQINHLQIPNEASEQKRVNQSQHFLMLKSKKNGQSSLQYSSRENLISMLNQAQKAIVPSPQKNQADQTQIKLCEYNVYVPIPNIIEVDIPVNSFSQYTSKYGRDQNSSTENYIQKRQCYQDAESENLDSDQRIQKRKEQQKHEKQLSKLQRQNMYSHDQILVTRQKQKVYDTFNAQIQQKQDLKKHRNNLSLKSLQHRVMIQDSSIQQEMNALKKQMFESQRQNSEIIKALMNEIATLTNDLDAKTEDLAATMDSLEQIKLKMQQKQCKFQAQLQAAHQEQEKLKQQLNKLMKRIKEDGMHLNYAEVQLLKQAIDERQKVYESNIQNLQILYESEIQELKAKCDSSILQGSHKQINCQQQHSQAKSSIKVIGSVIDSQLFNNQHNFSSPNLSLQVQKSPFFKLATSTVILTPKVIEQCIMPTKSNEQRLNGRQQQALQQVIELYDKEIEERDFEILKLKSSLLSRESELQGLTYSSSKQLPMTKDRTVSVQEDICDKDIVIEMLQAKIISLSSSLCKQRNNQTELTRKLLRLQEQIQQQNCEICNKTTDKCQSYQLNEKQQYKEYDLIMRLVSQVETQRKTIKNLKSGMLEKQSLSPCSEPQRSQKDKDKIKKLTQYCQILEKQVRALYKVDECQAHEEIIQRLEAQLRKIKNSAGQSPSEKIYSQLAITNDI